MRYIKGCLLFFLLLEGGAVWASSLEDISHQIQAVQISLDQLKATLKEKSEHVRVQQKSTEKIISALLLFTRPDRQHAFLFSSRRDYRRVSFILESLIRKTRESLFDLQQEEAELKTLIAQERAHKKELLQLEKSLTPAS